MKGFEKKYVKAVRFMANGREVIMKPVRAPIQDDSGTWLIVGFRFQWFRHDFSKKIARLSTDKWEYVNWEY